MTRDTVISHALYIATYTTGQYPERLTPAATHALRREFTQWLDWLDAQVGLDTTVGYDTPRERAK